MRFEVARDLEGTADGEVMAPARTQAKQPTPAEDRNPAASGLTAERAAEEPTIVLSLADLVRDENGEVVLFNDSGLRALAVSTNATVVAEGEVGRYVTAAGEDVAGFRYLAFDNGLKLFYQPGLDLVVVQEPTPAA
jgi:hypothetical protein